MVKRIPLTRSLFALVDDEDFDWLSRFRWSAVEGRCGAFYASRSVYVPRREGGPRQYGRDMQRDVMERAVGAAPPGHKADHRNGDTLDNRRQNLRWASNTASNINRRLFRNNTTGYRGVTFDKQKQRYKARLKIGGEVKVGKPRRTAEEAAHDYNELALRHHGPEAHLNVISDANGEADHG